MNESGFIYALGVHGSPYVKIGSTTDSVVTRMKALQTGHPDPLHIAASVEVASNVRHVEKRLHVMLHALRHKGEWFGIALDDAGLESLVAEAIATLTLPDSAIDIQPSGSQPELIGDRIRKARRRCGISAAALAKKTGSTRQYLSRIETNKSGDPGTLLVEKIIDTLNVSADYILSGREEPRRNLAELDGMPIATPRMLPQGENGREA